MHDFFVLCSTSRDLPSSEFRRKDSLRFDKTDNGVPHNLPHVTKIAKNGAHSDESIWNSVQVLENGVEKGLKEHG